MMVGLALGVLSSTTRIAQHVPKPPALVAPPLDMQRLCHHASARYCSASRIQVQARQAWGIRHLRIACWLQCFAYKLTAMAGPLWYW